MTSLNKKKRKCKNSFWDRGCEKGSWYKMKRIAMYHKKDRVRNKKLCEITDE